MQSPVSKIIFYVVAISSLMLVITGCKATSTLVINVDNNSSGSIVFSLEIDEAAEIALKRAAYKPITLEEIFDKEKLEAVGYKVSIVEEPQTKINISADFENEQELKNALLVIAPQDVVDGTLKVSKNLLYENTDLKLEIDLTKLREQYLQTDGIREKVEETSMTFEEYETIIEEAFEVTTLNIELISNEESSKAAIITKEQEVKDIQVQSSEFRTHYIFNMLGAIAALIAASVMFWRIRRKGSVVSYQTKE